MSAGNSIEREFGSRLGTSLGTGLGSSLGSGLGIESVAPEACTDPVLEGWQEQIRRATENHRPLVITGNGSKFFYGRSISGESANQLETSAYRGIIAYEPTELVITARAGTPLDEIEATLSERGQMLACEAPYFSGTPSIGGVVAAGLSGPRRMNAGAVRDFVLGVRIMNGHGQLLRFGGQVMKNVAGYDVSRLMAGSLGCLGVIAEVSLKVVPKPREECSLRFELTEREALQRLHVWGGKPLPLSASAWHDGILHLRLSGAEAAIAAARTLLGGTLIPTDEAMAFWRSLRDQTHDFFTTNSTAIAPSLTSNDAGTAKTTAPDDATSALIRLSLPDTTPSISLPGKQLIEWGGAQRWCHDHPDNLQKNRSIATSSGGHATLFRLSAGWRTANAELGPGRAAQEIREEVFTLLTPPLLRIHRQLKQAFDPAGIFNRGRMFREF